MLTYFWGIGGGGGYISNSCTDTLQLQFGPSQNDFVLSFFYFEKHCSLIYSQPKDSFHKAARIALYMYVHRVLVPGCFLQESVRQKQ